MRRTDKDSVKKFIVLFIIAFSVQSQAGILLEVGGTYLSDDLSASSSKSSTKYFYNVGALFSFTKTLWGGWNYSGISQSESGTVSTDYSSQDTGPYLKWQFGRSELFSLSAAYNIVSRGVYKSGSPSESWEGTSYWLQFAVSPEVTEGLHIGASLNYYNANYTKKTVSHVESSASYSKSWVFPMLTLTKQW